MPSLSERELDALLRGQACRLIRESAKHGCGEAQSQRRPFVGLDDDRP
jgi:hypothetical protein